MNQEKVVHAIQYGVLLCKLIGDIPGRLPEGHTFVLASIAATNQKVLKLVNCPKCAEKVPHILAEEI